MAINYTISYTFSPSTVISSAQVNQNFQDNANTWTGLEALTKSFSHLKVDNDPASALEVATKQYVDNSVAGGLVGNSKNRILNGEMLFDQVKEGATAYSTSSKSAIYCLDQWRIESTGTPDFTVQKSTESQPNPYFPSIMKIVSTTTGSPSSTDGCNLEYPMEPIYSRDFGWGTATAKTVTLSFWALSSVSGTYSISLLNGVDTRSYVSTYTLTANVWTFVTVTVPGDTTAPTTNWPTTGTVFGLKIVWDMGSGSVITTSNLNTWQAGAFWKATGSTNVVATATTFYLTGVQLEIGSSATTFEFSPYPEMLQKLQRYYYKTFNQGTAVAQGAGSNGAILYINQLANVNAYGVPIRFPVQMCGQPVVTFYNPISSNAKWRNLSVPQDSGTAAEVPGITAGSGGFTLYNPQASGDTVGGAIAVHMTANARLGGS